MEPIVRMEFEHEINHIGNDETHAQVGLYIRDADGQNRRAIFSGRIYIGRRGGYPVAAAETFQRYVEAGDFSGLSELQGEVLSSLDLRGQWPVEIGNTRLLEGKLRMDVVVYGDNKHGL